MKGSLQKQGLKGRDFEMSVMTSAYSGPVAANPRMTNGQKVAVALVASVLLHLVIFFFIGLIGLLNPDVDKKPLENLKLVSVTVATPTPKPVQIVPMVPLPESAPVTVIDSNGLHKTEKAPEKPAFESDTNLVAGSEKSGTGDLPLPSQDGKDRKELA